MTRARNFHLILLWTLAASVCWGDIQVTKQADSVVDPKALTIDGGFGQAINGLSFQQSPLVSLNGFQYVAYYDADRWVCVARRRLPWDAWEVARLTDYAFKSNDAHNVISMGICPGDGTLHLSFDHHVGPLHYRVSKVGVASGTAQVNWDASLFGPVLDELEPGMRIPSVTYPRFWPTPEGNLQFGYRRGGSGNGDRMLADYDAATGQWSGVRQIDAHEGAYTSGSQVSNSRCSYPNGYDYGPDGRLHMTWVWREGPGTANHDLMYAYSDDQGITWKSNAGEVLDHPAQLDSPGITVVPIPEALGLMNTHGQAVDSKGRIHAVVWHCTEESLKAAGSAPGQERWGPPTARRYHHYWRDGHGVWQHQELPGVAGNRPKILFDHKDNAYLILGGKHDKASGLHDPGALHILTAAGASGWTDWRTVHVEEGPFANEMLADVARWKSEEILSILVQESPEVPHQPTALRILDFSFGEG